jgi:cytochrome c553
MNKYLVCALIFSLSLPVFAAGELDAAFKLYKGSENLTFDAARGKAMWEKTYPAEPDDPFKERTCATCHGKDLTKATKHVKTGKPIDPMAPSVNKERFTELKKIEKWFKRNCKWTVGRECTNQEKGDLLTYLSQL